MKNSIEYSDTVVAELEGQEFMGTVIDILTDDYIIEDQDGDVFQISKDKVSKESI